MSEKFYKARRNEIIDEKGTPVAIVHPVTCSRKEAGMMAAFAAQQMNHEAARKARKLPPAP